MPPERWTPEKPYVHVHIRATDLPAAQRLFDRERIGIHYTRHILHVANRPEAAPQLDLFLFAYLVDWPPSHAWNLDELVVALLYRAGIQAMVSGQKVRLPV